MTDQDQIAKFLANKGAKKIATGANSGITDREFFNASKRGTKIGEHVREEASTTFLDVRADVTKEGVIYTDIGGHTTLG